MTACENRRILIVDDNGAIHADFVKVLNGISPAGAEFDDALAAVFGTKGKTSLIAPYEIEFAFQGREALTLVERSLAEARPFGLAFVDVRMPPGWDGLETTERLWGADPWLQVVLCTAYSDYSWSDVLDRLGLTDKLLVLKKPFDNIEVQQIAVAMLKKWSLARQLEAKLADFEVVAPSWRARRPARP